MAVVDLWHKADPADPRRKVRTARYGTGLRWAVRYAGQDGRERSRSFPNRDAAVAWDAQRRVSSDAGTLTDDRRARLTVGHYAEAWQRSKAGAAEATRHWYEVALRTHVRPRWGAVPVSRVTRASVNEWLAGLAAGTEQTCARPLSSGRVRGLHAVLSGVLSHAVDDRAIAANPAAGAKLPRLVRALAVPLEATELQSLYLKLPRGTYRGGEQYHREVLLVLAFTGLRFSEFVALTVGDLSVQPSGIGRLRVDDAETVVSGRRVRGDTKSHAERDVSVPAAVAARLVELAAGRPNDAPLVPAPKGGAWSYTTWRRALAKACVEAGLPKTRTHALRHTAASLSLAAGADVKVVQAQLGHASAQMTLQVYAHLMPGRLDEVAGALAHLVPSEAGDERGLRAV